MVHPFVSTRTVRFSRIGGLALSAATHVGLIAATIVATTTRLPVRTPGYRDREPGEHVTWITSAPRAALGARAARVARRAAPIVRTASHTPAAAPSIVPMSIEPLMPTLDLAAATPELPGPDLASLATSAGELAEGGIAKLLKTVLGRAYARPATADAYSSEVVERAIWPADGNPKPQYPRPLLAAGIEQNVFVHFVVDSTGRVDPKTLSFPPEAHTLFVASIRDALLRSRFFPAELGGHRVRQLVEQQFKFVLAR